MKKRIFAVLLTTVMAVSVLAGCGGSKGSSSSGSAAGSTAPTASEAVGGSGVFKSVESFPYGSIDPHKEYYAWHTQKYGLSEALFRIDDNMQIQPWLAKDIAIEDNVATVTLKDGLVFSNGEAVTADMVGRNIQRVAEVNKRFAYMGEWGYEATDDKTLVITTGDSVYPTLKNNLADPAFAIMDLDNTTDFDNNPICTGPFAVDKFVPQGDITLKRNDNYWDGAVNCEGAIFYAMSDNQSKLMAMQNGEIDAYDNITSSDIELFAMEPENYTLSSVPMQMRSYMFVNSKNVADPVRKAIGLAIDRDAIAAFMPGMMTGTSSAFDEDAAYGKVSGPKFNLDEAAKVMTDAGYTLENGVYTKDGQPVSVALSCYQARNIDTIAVIVAEQLNKFGIKAEVKIVDNPDGTYMAGDDYDIAFYRSITDLSGDPLDYFDKNIKKGSYSDVAGFGNDETDALIEELRYTVDPAKRAEIANQIMEQVYASNTYIFLTCYNRNACLAKGATGFNETNPYEFYGISATTTTKAE